MSDTGKIIALAKALGGGADPAVISQAVEDWLDDHPEATTTVQDGSITADKLASALADVINGKQTAPGTAGTAGQVLGLDSNLDPAWINQSGGGGGGAVDDVQVNGTSIVSGGVANVPVASANGLGVVLVDSSKGITVDVNSPGKLVIVAGEDYEIKNGTQLCRPIVPTNQHKSVFYGLAKAAGDSTQAASDNAVGTYTDDAKNAIKEMLGIPVWRTAILSESDYDSELGMFVFDAGNGKEIAEARVAGQVVWDTQIAANSDVGIGFGNTPNKKYTNEFCSKSISNAYNRLFFTAEGKFVNLKNTQYSSRYQYGNGFYSTGNQTTHGLNYDLYGSSAFENRSTMFYHINNDPRYFHITAPAAPDWAYIQIEYTLR